jgi:hypothetical protein
MYRLMDVIQPDAARWRPEPVVSAPLPTCLDPCMDQCTRVACILKDDASVEVGKMKCHGKDAPPGHPYHAGEMGQLSRHASPNYNASRGIAQSVKVGSTPRLSVATRCPLLPARPFRWCYRVSDSAGLGTNLYIQAIDQASRILSRNPSEN